MLQVCLVFLKKKSYSELHYAVLCVSSVKMIVNTCGW
jgi:hypothetical protein